MFQKKYFTKKMTQLNCNFLFLASSQIDLIVRHNFLGCENLRRKGGYFILYDEYFKFGYVIYQLCYQLSQTQHQYKTN